MTSPDHGDAPADHGLLTPAWAGSAAEAATTDRAFLQAMLDAETALSSALGAPDEVLDRIRAAARAGRLDIRDLALRARAGGNPVIPMVADLRAGLDDEAAAWVHRGATSQDIVDTALMLVAARTLPLILADLDAVDHQLLLLAERHRQTPMAGRTLTQHAVPTTFGLKAAGWRHLVLDARDRLAALALPAQLGGAAGTLASLGSDPELLRRYAGTVGLHAPDLPWHVLRTPVAELGSALALTGGALAKIAADVLLLSRTETGELAESGGGGSSTMPHKSNPVHAVLTAAAARQLPALTAVLHASMAAEDERPAGAWHAEWNTVREALRLTGGAGRHARAMTAGLRVDEHRMRANLDLTEGVIVSERLVGILTPHLGAAAARTLLTRAARIAAAAASPLADVLSEQPELRALPDLGRLRELLDPTGYLGAAPALTDRALRRRRKP